MRSQLLGARMDTEFFDAIARTHSESKLRSGSEFQIKHGDFSFCESGTLQLQFLEHGTDVGER
jgi:hypothetical protein